MNVTAYVLRFVAKCRKLFVSNNSNDLSNSELVEAENYLIKTHQKIHFSQILDHFENKSRSCPSIVKQLNLTCSKGIIRCTGRMQNSSLPANRKNPILIHANSWFSRLIVENIHSRNLHCGAPEILQILRDRFWMPHARQFVKSVVKKCVQCRKVLAKSYNAPPPPPLPHARINQARPFQVTGVDYTGFLNVKQGEEIIKAYIVLFTCAVTRAIHLEVVTSNSEQDFVRALNRFVSRRSTPSTIYSDNAAVFVSVAKKLKTIINDHNRLGIHPSLEMEWRFITPRAPWHGGFYERMVGITKNTVKIVLGKSLLTLDELHTIAVQIECKINDRPLTYVSDEHDAPQALTPSQLIYGFRLNELPDLIDSDEYMDPSFTLNKCMMNKRLAHCTLVMEHFWKRWCDEYLSSLREKHNLQGKNNHIVKGTVVLMHDDCPRVRWKLGVIVEPIEGADGVVRSATIRTATGNYTRPVTKLYPLEVTSKGEIDDIPTEDRSRENIRPRRKAAEKAAELIKQFV